MKNKLLLIALFISLSSWIVFSQEWYQSRVIITEVWADFPDADLLDDLTQTLNEHEDPQVHLTRQKRVNKALDDVHQMALQIYSDIIFGYVFEYTPSDLKRNIEEKWVLTQIAKIPEGDTHLYDISRDVYNNQIAVVFRYDLSAEQFEWLQRWQNAEIFSSKGVGLVPSVGKHQVEGKYAAMKDAYKQAIRKRLQDMMLNKPLRVTGLVRLEDQPYLTKNGSYYEAKVKISMKIDNVTQQQAY